MNASSPGPTPTPTSSTETIERPPKTNKASSSNTIIISPSLDNSMPYGNNEEEDTLLTFYQSLVPPHVRVFRRDHPDRRPNESDEEYEFRWQFYEYAKLHPLTRPTFFLDIEIKDELLVPVVESASSSCFTIIDENEVDRSNITKNDDSREQVRNDHDHGQVYVWEIESVPNTLPLESPKELKKFSKTCIRLHSTVSMSNLSTLGSEDSLEILDIPSPPPGLKTSTLFSPRRTFFSKPSKSVTFANPITNIRRFSTRPSPQSRSLPRVFNNKTPYYLKCPPSRNSRSLERHVKLKTFEEMFHRPKSIPSKSLYATVEQRKQLSQKYTFFMQKRRQNKLGRQYRRKSPDRLEWVSDRLHRGESAVTDISDVEESPTTTYNYKINKAVPKILKFPNLSKLFRNRRVQMQPD